MKVFSFKLDLLMIEKQSTLEWIDFILTIVLDSSDNEVNSLSLTQYQNMAQMLLEKKQKYISFINHQTLGLSSRRKVQHLLKQHHGSLLILLDQADIITAKTNPLNTLPISILRDTTNCIYELLTIIENRFADYLDLDERAPQVYVQQFAVKFETRVNMVKEGLRKMSSDPDLIGILTAQLSTGNINNKAPSASFRGIFYQRDLIYGLEQILTADRQMNIDNTLIEFLVYMNFNSRPFMNYYTQYLSKQINYVDSVTEKITELLLRFKEFNQMHRKPGVKLLPSEADMKKVISNWFTQEISFLKEKLHLDAPLRSPSSSHTYAKQEPFKVMILLSVDQIGLFLRALDSLRVLKAKSLNAVFQSITPFLSTPRQTEISWDSMRSKSYAFEEKDKQAVIKVLESVITWIREY